MLWQWCELSFQPKSKVLDSTTRTFHTATENSDDYTFSLTDHQAKAASVVSFYNAL